MIGTEYEDSTIGLDSFLSKQFPKIWAFLVLFLEDYLCNQIFGFMSAFEPFKKERVRSARVHPGWSAVPEYPRYDFLNLNGIFGK